MSTAYDVMVSVLGLCVSIAAKRTIVTSVVLEGSQESPSVIEVFDLKTDADGVVAQLEYLSRALSSKLSSRDIDAAVVRTADTPPAGSRKAGPRNRLLIEGALLLTCQQKAPHEAYIRSGRDIGDVLGTTKDEALSRGEILDARRRDAAAAALSQLPRN